MKKFAPVANYFHFCVYAFMERFKTNRFVKSKIEQK